MTPETIAAVPTKIIGIAGTGVTWAAAMMGLLNLLVGGALVALIKNWPALKKIATERANALDDERRDDMEKMRERMTALEGKVEAAQAKAQSAENTLSVTISAITLLSAELRREKPDSPVLAEVQEMLANAAAGDFGFMAGLRKLARATGDRTKS